ncbi:unnamed protein product [Leptosia nina]|uniref:Uncharacterized protein n=1 Tax=Leptosia nina TaxID=320188 RepID=A0AAV1JN40_9NEOP
MNQNVQKSCNIYYSANYNYTSINNKEDGAKMHGSRRVVVFCLLTTFLPSIHKGQSSIFCEKHSLKMNNTFNAFQMKGRPQLSQKRKHITLRKSMSLPDDTLEYWGFYLFAGATVELKACSRYEGSKILVVKGEKTLDTCGILEGSHYKNDAPLIEKSENVSVTLQSPNILNNPNPIISEKKFYDDDDNNTSHDVQGQKLRNKRDTLSPSLHNPHTILDTGVNHGGNAFPKSKAENNDRSVSSFENNLYQCYNKNILINEYFPYSIQCNNTKYLEITTTLKVVHEVTLDGYYYYIFYSDNDIVINDVHAIFDIYKPVFQYSNMSDPKICINKTECSFDVTMFSDELVIVDIPTRDGLKNEDNSILITEITTVYKWVQKNKDTNQENGRGLTKESNELIGTV